MRWIGDDGGRWVGALVIRHVWCFTEDGGGQLVGGAGRRVRAWLHNVGEGEGRSSSGREDPDCRGVPVAEVPDVDPGVEVHVDSVLRFKLGPQVLLAVVGPLWLHHLLLGT